MIRMLEASDREEWRALFDGYLTFYKAEIADAVKETTLARLLDPAEPMHAALALEDGRPVGLVHYLYHRSTWTTGDYCYLQDLVVDGARRGGGYGRRLIEHVYAAAAKAGCSRVHWLTHETNADAMVLYDRIAARSGFVQYRKIF